MVRRPGGDGCYLVLRDTVLNEVPTQWHFWTLSEAIGTPSEMGDRATVLAAKPGHKNMPLRALDGDRFVAIGQFGRDIDAFVAAPVGTPRYTMRYGSRQSGYGLGSYHEYQDLLHLQREGAGEYVVAMVPRRSAARAPTFQQLGGGAVVAVHRAAASDYCFLSDTPTRARDRQAELMFRGTSGVVLARPTGTTLVLTAPGEMSFREYGLAAAVPVALQATPHTLTVEFGGGTTAPTEVTVTAPGKWRPVVPDMGVGVTQRRGRVVLTVPAKERRLVLRR